MIKVGKAFQGILAAALFPLVAWAGLATQNVLRVTPVVADGTPNAFSFTDQTAVAVSSTITSNTVTINGINTGITCSATGGTLDKNGAGTFASSQSIVNNDTIRARHTSSASNSTATNTVVDCNGVSDTFTSTTEAGGTSPTYTPFYTWSAAGGTLGNAITGWTSATDVTYSNDVTGPHGGSVVAKVAMTANDHGFGGNMVSGLAAQDIGNGDDIWIKVHHYFPNGYCFSSNSLSEPNWGNTKWYRIEFTNSTRLTAQTGSLGGTAFADGPTCGTQVGWGGFSDEYGGSGANRIQASPAQQVTRGTWLALQVHVVLRTDATGYMESWIGSTYQGRAEINCSEPDCTNGGVTDGQTSYITAPPGGSPISFIVFGDYWNGGVYFTQDFYIDEIIITTQTPNTTDSGGRPYIAPTTRVSDF